MIHHFCNFYNKQQKIISIKVINFSANKSATAKENTHFGPRCNDFLSDDLPETSNTNACKTRQRYSEKGFLHTSGTVF